MHARARQIRNRGVQAGTCDLTKVRSTGMCLVPSYALFDPAKQPVLQRHLIAGPGLDLGPDPGSDLGCPVLVEVKVAAGVGSVHQVHRGSSPEGVMLYAGVWGRQHDRNDDVQVRGDADKTDFARLLMLFLYKSKHGLKVEAAFVNWYTPDIKRVKRAANLRLARLEIEQQSIPGLGICPRTDIAPLTSIIGPGFLQPDSVKPTGTDKSEQFYYNHWVGNTAEGT
ncbi:MAG: hypothetical protein FRX49_13779 [Trebouxia sp. A1-2]|nr:MAG: hypothetical protein FRX49_13811 [Trebouxia sp. A1-2]KAA6412349.1 MAG: hypothetical protein FRX49_13779 [Trebouxia sp. A1-2]